MAPLPCAKEQHPAHAQVLVCYCGRDGCNAPAKPQRKPVVATTHPNHPNALEATRRLQKVVAHYGDACYLCGGPAESADHLMPRALGGVNAFYNLRPCCLRCNNQKADVPLALFLAQRCRDYAGLKKWVQRINPLKNQPEFEANFQRLAEVAGSLSYLTATSDWVVFADDEYHVGIGALAEGLWPDFMVWNGGDVYRGEEG